MTRKVTSQAASSKIAREQELLGKKFVDALVKNGTAQYAPFSPKEPLDFPEDVASVSWIGIDPPNLRADPQKLKYIFEIECSRPKLEEGVVCFPAPFSYRDLSIVFASYSAKSPHVRSMRNAVIALNTLMDIQQKPKKPRGAGNQPR